MRINVVTDGIARPVAYSPDFFDFGGTGLEQKLPPGLGFSGFRVMNGRNDPTDWLAFQGASYFRSAGQQNQYGASARGIAVNTALSTKEEFPRFAEFWLAEPHPERPIDHHLCAARRAQPDRRLSLRGDEADGAVMDVRAELFMRGDIARLGIAPLTSMYWYGENERRLGHRLASGNPRQRRAGTVDRQGRAHLAAADRSALGAHQFLSSTRTPRASA